MDDHSSTLEVCRLMISDINKSLTLVQKEYCPPIDTALFYAITSDFDLSKPELLQSARATLDDIKATAEAEESAFDPSGSSNVHDSDNVQQDSHGKARSGSGDRLTSSDHTDLTSLTASVHSVHLGSVASGSNNSGLQDYDYGIESLPTQEKLAILAESFPGLKPFDISYTLTRCGDNVEKAIDELLTRSFFEDDLDSDGERHVVPKGIEGFAQNDNSRPKRKGKKKKKKLDASSEVSISEAGASSSGSVTQANKWIAGKQDIQFVMQKTNLPLTTTNSAYHKSHGSLRNTIIHLAEANVAQSPIPINDEDAIIQINIAELSVDFPTISVEHLRGIVKLTHPSTASAHDLAKALFSSPFAIQQSIYKETHLIPQYARPAINEDDSFITVSRKHTARLNISTESETANLLAAKHNAARATAFAQANAAYRKSRSNPLMGGAAAYYASVGHEAQAAANAHSSAAADALVLQQSTSKQIDLHGVDVLNATRIAGERVQAWWDSGRAEWAREGRVMGDGGFSIITGVGKHSQGGRARLGPAVRKSLVQEGWRVDEESGVLTVIGRARK